MEVDMEKTYSEKAVGVYLSYGHTFGWALDKCQMLVEDYQDDKAYEEMRCLREEE
jgi:hypothetical protein